MPNSSPTWILVDGGDVFDGSPQQFRACFLTEPTRENIQDWARVNDRSVEFLDRGPYLPHWFAV